MPPTGNVKVVVRVRPMNKREIERNAKCVVQMQGKMTILQNPAKESDTKKFTYDHSYWSMDKAQVDKYATQDRVFKDLGEEVLDASFEGYNTCVFAYGQTGAGKTYSMMGYGDEPGLVPRICEGLFERAAAKSDDGSGTKYSAVVSYLEIYNEQVRDLLITAKQAAKKTNLRVREDPKTGPFVEGLTAHTVSDFAKIEELMEMGNGNRTTAATGMNDTSSRSHAVFTMTFTQMSFVEGVPAEKSSKINLVDLAGSERTSSTGATGVRLKEGGNINKSLTTLGLCIKALAERGPEGSGKAKKETFIPFRNSVLTWLLKDSLGGNSCTMMVAAISPADINYGETLSTLYYANSAKNIINKPVVNEDPNVRIIKELKAEIDRLKSFLGGDEAVAQLEAEREAARERLDAAGTEEEREAAQAAVDKLDEELTTTKGGNPEAIQAQLAASEKMMAALTSSFETKWKGMSEIMDSRALALKETGRAITLHSEQPHLVSLNLDDDLATGIVMYYIHDGVNTVGLEDQEPAQDIVITGNGVMPSHCTITFDGDEECLLAPASEECIVVVNGSRISEPTNLSQGNTVQMGHGNLFRFNNPKQAARLRESRKGSESTIASMPTSEPGTPGEPHMYGGGKPMLYDQQQNDLMEATRKRLQELESLQEEHDGRLQATEEAKRALEQQRTKDQEEMAERLRKMEEQLQARDAEVAAEKARREELEARAKQEAEAKQQLADEAAAEAELQRARAEDLEGAALAAQRAIAEKESAFELEKQKNADEHRLWMQKMEEEEMARLKEIQQLQQEQVEAAKLAEEQARIAAEVALEKARTQAELEAKQRLVEEQAQAHSEKDAANAAALTTLQREKQEKEAALAVALARPAPAPAPAKRGDSFEDIWALEIVQAHERDVGSSHPYTSYEVTIKLHGDVWRVFRRFSQFERFHKLMKARIPSVANYVPFPKKKMFEKSTDPVIVKRRKQDLEIYLVNIVSKSFRNPQSPFYMADRSSLQRIIPFFRPGEGL